MPRAQQGWLLRAAGRRYSAANASGGCQTTDGILRERKSEEMGMSLRCLQATKMLAVGTHFCSRYLLMTNHYSEKISEQALSELIAGILASDYWLVKRRKVNVPALYDPHGRYRYWHGLNWGALVAFMVSLGPNLPGLANSVSPSLGLKGGIVHLWDVNYLYGLYVAVFVYVSLNLVFPPQETFVPETISGDIWPETAYGGESDIIESVSADGSRDTVSDEKKPRDVETEKF
ncbi:hypothetical protein V1504DRAFT_434844 [Lipomyces starkeyi]